MVMDLVPCYRRSAVPMKTTAKSRIFEDVVAIDQDASAEPFVICRGYAYDYAMPAMRGIPGPYRLFFVSFDCHEPKHVHVQRERRVCKYWMEPVVLAGNHGFSPVEPNTVRQLLRDNSNQILEASDEHCGTRR